MFARRSTVRSTAVVVGVSTALGLGFPIAARAALELSIADIQGSGAASPYLGDEVTTNGVVTASYPTGGYEGFVIQAPGSGGAGWLDEAGPSSGIFVSAPGAVGDAPIGAAVVVTGIVQETGGLTLIAVGDEGTVKVTGDGRAIAPVPVDGPLDAASRESLESMLVQPTGEWVVAGTGDADRTGDLVLATGSTPPRQPTDVASPRTEDHDRVVEQNAARTVVLSDGALVDYLDPKAELDPPYLSPADPLRVGAGAEFTGPVIAGDRDDRWTFDPSRPALAKDPASRPARFQSTRTDAPSDDAIGAADVRSAAFDLGGYFVDLGIDDPDCQPIRDRAGDGITVDPASNPDCLPRGAWDKDDRTRQEAKLVAAITALRADVVGLTGVENTRRVTGEPDRATARLVELLNAAVGGSVWAAVPSPEPDAEASAVTEPAIIYRADRVTPAGEAVTITEATDPGRVLAAAPPLAQRFEPAGGAPFVQVVTQLAGRDEVGALPGDEDTGDGQALSNGTRIDQASALRDWVRTITDPSESVLLAGNLNAFTLEDPLQTLYDAGYADAATGAGSAGFTGAADGAVGSTVHLLVNGPARARTTGADVWGIDAGESPALGYAGFGRHPSSYYEPGPFRAAAQDPVVVGLSGRPGAQPLTSILADITRAHPDGVLDQSQESALGAFVASWMATALAAPESGGALFGAIEPSGITGDLAYEPDGVVTDVEAAAVLGSNAPLVAVGVSGRQIIQLLNEQWRDDGSVVMLGLSDNVTYTYDPERSIGDRVTSVTLDDMPLDPDAVYPFATTAELAGGADGFHLTEPPVLVQPSDVPARDAFVSHLGAGSAFEANFARQGAAVSPLPTTVEAGGTISATVSGLDLTSLGAPVNTRLSAEVDGVRIVQVPVGDGSADVSAVLPEWVEPGEHTLTLRARPSGTLITVPITVTPAA